ncbi:MAG: hypothetical protein ACRYG7_31840 [Janthinobacterium lividum]
MIVSLCSQGEPLSVSPIQLSLVLACTTLLAATFLNYKGIGFGSFLSVKIPKMGDEFFGEMLFIAGKTSAEGYFECQRNFGPTGEQIEIGIDGNLSGPTQRQKDFFRQVEATFPFLIPRLIEVIEKEFGAWMSLPVIKDFAAEFKPIYLRIPTCDQEPN